MFNRGERERTRITAETTPYRNMAVDIEVDSKLQTQEFDLAIAKRHLFTSNDRYQLSTAYLYEARNRYALANSITEELTNSQSSELRGPAYSVQNMTDFLGKTYQDAKNGLEHAEEITSTLGFQATASDTRKFTQFQDGIKWPEAAAVSRNFIKGSIHALDNIWAYVSTLYDTTINDTNLPNDFRLRLQVKIPQLLTIVDNKRRAIDRITASGVESIATTQLLEEVYADIIETYKTLEKITSWLAMPRIQDSYFELREQYDETKPEEKKFDVTHLGTSAVQQIVSPSGKPFTLDSLNTPTPAGPSSPIRRFNPADLETSHPIDPPQPTSTSKPFNLNDLKTQEAEDKTPKGRSFDPSDLHTESENPQSSRHFTPEDLDKTD